MATTQLLNLKEVSRRLDRRVSTLRKDLRERRLPYVRIGRQVRVPIEAVEELIAKGWREPIEGA